MNSMMKRALIVDDSRALRTIMGRILRDLGYEVSEAADGKAALEVLTASAPFDVALVDWNMPVMSGLELIVAVRASSTLCPLPILMVTTESEAQQVTRALAAGANEYLMKPFSRDAVADKLMILGLRAA